MSSPPYKCESENEDDSSSSSGEAQTPPSLNRLRIAADAHSLKSHTPTSIKSEHSSHTAHTRSPSSGSMAPNHINNNNSINNNNNNNINNNDSSSHPNNMCGATSLTCMASASPYAVNANLSAPPPLPHPTLPTGHYNQPNPLLYHHLPPPDWYHSAAVPPTPTDINHLNHFSLHHHQQMHHATAY